MYNFKLYLLIIYLRLIEYDGRANRGSLSSTLDNVPNWHQPSPSYKQLVCYIKINLIILITIFNIMFMMQMNNRQHTITIHDTPSPAVSVITISDSEDEASTKG